MMDRLLSPGCGIFVALLAATASSPSFAHARSIVYDGTGEPACARLPAARPTVISEHEVLGRGRMYALVIFAQFADEGTAQDTPPAFADDLFDSDVAGSLTHFYDEMSGGQFRLVGGVLPRWYRSNRSASAYVAAEPGVGGAYGRFVREILVAADADADLAEFDNDGPDGVPDSGDDDGFVDLVFVITRSAPPGFIISTATGLARLGLESTFVSNDQTIDRRTVLIRADHSTVVGGVLQRGQNFAEAVGTMAHEFGHVLGLPDLFDTDFTLEGNKLDPSQDSAGIGYWGLMGHGTRGWDDRGGPNPFSAWSLMQLGWIGDANDDLVILEQDTADLVFEDAGGEPIVYKLPGQTTVDTSSPVYYLLEHRRPGSNHYERNLPGSGLLIWRIDETALPRANSAEHAKLVDLVCADGLFDDAGAPQGLQQDPDAGSDNLDFWAHDPLYTIEHAGNLGDEGDFFDGERGADEFSVVSNPAISAASGLVIEAIRRQGDSMRANVRFGDRRRAGRIDSHRVWRDTVEVVGDVTIAPGVTLSIAPGTVVLIGPDQRSTGLDSATTEMVVFGRLVVNGGQDGALFTSAAPAPAPGDWYGIRTSFGDLQLSGMQLEYATIGLSGDLGVPGRVEHLTNVTISQTSGHGIDLRARGRANLSRLVVENAGGTGMRFSGDGEINMDECTISGSASHGLEREAGWLNCDNCTFSSNGVSSADGASNLLLENRVKARITQSSFTGGVGIRLERAGETLVEGNQFSDHMTGVISRDTRLQLGRNSFVDCDLAFETTGIGAPVRITFNSIEGSAHLIQNTSSFTVVAEQNWWGRDDEAWIEERMTGLVEWRPALNFDPRLPVDFVLKQNFPNPFNASTVIDYSVSLSQAMAGADMTLEIRNAAGGLVRRLVHGPIVPGIYSTIWRGVDGNGEAVASGTYFYLLKVGTSKLSRKLMVIR